LFFGGSEWIVEKSSARIPFQKPVVEALVLSSKYLFFSFLAKLTEKPHAGVSKAST